MPDPIRSNHRRESNMQLEGCFGNKEGGRLLVNRFLLQPNFPVHQTDFVFLTAWALILDG